MPARPPRPVAPGLSGLRGRAALPDLLFLYECATLEPARLRDVAERLGLTVQAASHTFRGLYRRGLVEVRDGRYRPTIAGVARLHRALDGLAADLQERIAHLHVVRSTRAVALASVVAGEPVALEIRDGLLVARPARGGASRGTVVRGGGAGALVEVGGLVGIVPIREAEITVRTLSDADLDDPGLSGRLSSALPPETGVVAAVGPEAFHALRQSTDRPIVRFAAGPACLEASRLGVPATAFVLERDLPQLLGSFEGPAPPKLRVLPVTRSRRSVRPVASSSRRGGRATR